MFLATAVVPRLMFFEAPAVFITISEFEIMFTAPFVPFAVNPICPSVVVKSIFPVGAENAMALLVVSDGLPVNANCAASIVMTPVALFVASYASKVIPAPAVLSASKRIAPPDEPVDVDPVDEIVATPEPAVRFTPAAVAASVRAPADVVKLDAPAELIATAPEPVHVAVPVLLMFKAAAFNVAVCPVPFKSNAPPVDVTVTPPAPESVRAPADVVKFEAAPPSIVTPPVPPLISTKSAFNSDSVDAAFPIVIVLRAAPVPILIAPVVPESIETAPVVPVVIATPPVPDCMFVVAEPVTEPTVTVCATAFAPTLTPPVPAFNTTDVVEVALPIVIVLASVVSVPMFTADAAELSTPSVAPFKVAATETQAAAPAS